MDIFKKMDYKKRVSLTTVAIVLAFVDAYITVLSDAQLMGKILPVIQNEILRNFALWGIQFVLLGAFGSFVYLCVSSVYSLHWRIKNKSIWYNGTWYHIHDKKNVRVGKVKIKQKFYDLEVTAINYDAEKKKKEKTTWRYIGHELPNGANGNSLIGCYSALREQHTKYGFHILSTVEENRWGTPVQLLGEFGDVLKLSEYYNENIFDKMGELHLYKITRSNKKIFKKYIKDVSKLQDVCNDPAVAKTDFVMTLKKVLDKNKYIHHYKEVVNALENNSFDSKVNITKDELSTNTKRILCRLVICDDSLNAQEVLVMNNILGTDWDFSDLQSIFDLRDNDRIAFDAELRRFVLKLKQDTRLYSAFKIAIKTACEILAKSDGVVTEEEEEYIKRMNDFFGRHSAADEGDEQLVGSIS